MAAYVVPGTWTPPTSFTMVIFDSAFDPFQRSTARVRARRTRGSSQGFFSWCGTTQSAQSHGLSLTVIFEPSAPTRTSRAVGLNARNSMSARSPRTAAMRAAVLGMKIAR